MEDGAAHALAKLPFFAELDGPSLAALALVVARRRYDRHEVVARAGGAVLETMVIVRGCLRVSRAPAPGVETVFGLGPGDVLGESLDGADTRHVDDVRAFDDAGLVVVERARFDALVDASPSLARALRRAAERRMLWLQGQLEDRAARTLPQRVARLLLHLADRHGQRANGDVVIAVRFSQGDLGDLLGATRESVNRVLCGMTSVVDVRDRRLIVRDLAALHAQGGVLR